MKHSPLSHLTDALAELESAGLFRRPTDARPSDELSFCSNDYLGLARRLAPSVESGAGASRLVAGEHPAHRALERALSSWLGFDEALLFTSGYAANVGTIAALAGPADLIVSDALNHASIIDGARLSKARVAVVPHLDLDAIDRTLAGRREARAWVLVESYYSMDADGPDLRALRDVCDRHDAALYVDEAHALGILGPDGRGRCAEFGVLPDVFVGTLGKALGSQGAFVGGAPELRTWLWNRARSFVFSTGLAPVAAASALQALAIVRAEPDLARSVRRRADALRGRLEPLATGLSPGGDRGVELLGFGHIVPLVVGAPQRAVRLAAALRERGVPLQAIRPPTVPEGRARLRLTVTARQSDEALARAAEALADVLASE